MRAIKQNTASRHLQFLMVDSTDHITGKTGLTPTVLLSKNGATFTSPSGSVTEVGRGWYRVAGNATDSNTLGSLVLSATGTDADPSDTEFEVVSYDPQSAWNVGKDGYALTAGTGLGNQTANITGTVSTVTNLTNLPSIPANWLTAAGIATGAFTSANFAAGAFDAVWGVTTRTLSAFSFNVTVGTNNDKSGYGLAADQAVNVTKVSGTTVSGPNDLKADVSGIKAVTDKLDGMLVLDGSVYQWTINSLELAPAGGGGGSTDWTADERTAIRAILGIPGSGSTPADPTVGILDTIRDGLGGGGGGTDWTADQKTAIMSILGIPASGTTPTDPTVGILDTIRDGLGGGGGVADWTADQKTAIMAILGIPASGTTPADPTVGILDTIRDNVGGVPAAVWASGTRTLSAFGFSVTVGTNNDKSGYGLAADQAVNVTKVGGTSVTSPNDLKADLAGIPAAVWGHGSRTLTAFAFSVLTSLSTEDIELIQDPILAAISVIAPGAADYAIRLEVKYQGNGVANAKVAIAGTTAAAFTDSSGLAQLNVSADTIYSVRITPPDGYQFVADFAVQVLTADVTVPITLVANSIPSIVPPLRVTYDEIRRHVGRFLGFGSIPDAFEASQSLAVEDTIRQGLRDVYFPSINGAPYEWSFLKRYTELQFSGGNTFALPTSFVRLASQVTVPGLGYPLRQVSESALRSMAIDSTESGAPVYYALSADGDALQLGVTLYQMRLFPVPPADSGHAEFWYHTSPEIDLDEGGPLGGIDLAATIIECCLARAELAQNVESLGQGGGVHLARSQEMLRRSIEADRVLQAETLSVSMADQMRPQQQ